MANIIEMDRTIVYSYFDEIVVPLLREKLPNTDEECIEIEIKINKAKPNYTWCLKKYENTYRLSARSLNNFTYFMVWTPEDLKEYTKWPDNYYGCRGDKYEQ